MHLEFLVEEESAEAFLCAFIPRFFGKGVSFRVHAFQGKRDLLTHLPARLRSYRLWMPEDWRLMVLVDRDHDDCRTLKARLERTAMDAGFATKTAAGTGMRFDVVNRIAIEELEAWYFGDPKALADEFPGVPPAFQGKQRFRDPDAIQGGTWEALERLLRSAGHYPGGLAKIDLARRMASRMEIDGNRSRSFRQFVAGLRALAA